MTTTINSVSFVLSTLTLSSGQYNVTMVSAGGNRHAVHSMGRRGFTFDMTGFVTTLAAFENVRAEFMTVGENDLVLRTGGYTYKVFTLDFEPLHNYDEEIVKYPFRALLLTEDTDIDLGYV